MSVSQEKPKQTGPVGRAPELYLVPGRVMLETGEEFPCKAIHVSMENVQLVAEHQVSVDQFAICHLDDIGILPGRIVQIEPQGFTLRFTVKENRRGRIASRIEWHANRASRTTELRAAPRIVPIHRAVEVRLGEQILFKGLIIDISMSGAAIALGPHPRPFIGSLIRVGARYARVVRELERGIAVQFVEPFTRENFDERVKL